VRTRFLLSLLFTPVLAVLGGGAASAQSSTDGFATGVPANVSPLRPIASHMAFEGSEAFATWSSADMVTSVAVLDGQLQVGSGQPVNEPTLFVEYVSEETDPTTGTRWLTVLSGTPSLEPSQFGIDDQLRNAFVNANLTLQGVRCAPPDLEPCQSFTADATVSVTWTGHDKIVPSFYVSRDIGQDFRYVFRAQGTLREATADGSITGDVDLISGPTDIAYIARTSNSDILWIRQR
jgi:hypothetical protein